MTKVPEIKVLNVDGIEYAVDAMSDVCRQLVGIYNDWSQKELDARDELTMIQAAKETLSRRIINQIRTEKAEAEAAATQTTKEDGADNTSEGE